jgi:acetoin:2,6-dichlorophenolindophenol oxidoreductase subunit alpha
VNGNDPEAMWRASGEAVARARAGEGPTLIEAKTFRFMGHYFGDPGAYIPKEEYDDHMSRDPMPIARVAVLSGGAATEAELDAYDAEVNALIDEALQFAADSPFPDVGEIDIDVYGAAA